VAAEVFSSRKPESIALPGVLKAAKYGVAPIFDPFDWLKKG
jgi:hypothetical protein